MPPVTFNIGRAFPTVNTECVKVVYVAQVCKRLKENLSSDRFYSVESDGEGLRSKFGREDGQGDSEKIAHFFTQVQTPVTLCGGELWSILVVRLAHVRAFVMWWCHLTIMQGHVSDSKCSRSARISLNAMCRSKPISSGTTVQQQLD